MSSRNRRRKATRIDAVDRLAAIYQQARLHARAMRDRLAAALATGDRGAIRDAHVRLRSAAAWESRTEQRYISAVMYEHAPLDHPAAARRAA